MDRGKFKQNLVEALEFHNSSLTNEELETFLELNFDDDSSMIDWTFKDFNEFAIDIVENGLKEASIYLGLHYDGEDEDDEDDLYDSHYEVEFDDHCGDDDKSVRLDHLYELYKMEPNDLTSDELQELRDAGYDIEDDILLYMTF